MARIDRVSSELKRYISEIVQKEIKDPHVGFVTITEVRVTSDFDIAKVYFSVLGDETQKELSLDALKRSAGFIRKHLAVSLNMRRTPSLDFRLDESEEYGRKIDELFKKIHGDKKDDADKKDM